MNPNEVLHFLLPQANDPLQVGFLAIILFMMGFTIVSAHRTARPASWERKWNRGTPHDNSDDLDIEHGSVTDLWHAVATAPEKLAEIMPGMLLVVGLLGTFLGLGLALNHASNILGQPNALSASGAANSMQDLLGLLQGLGTKFKTSTWGITGFVLLKIWSEFTRFEEKRLTWVIDKVKSELETRKQQQLAAETARQEALFAKIGGAAKGIVQGFAQQIVTLVESDKALQQQTLHCLDHNTKGIREDLMQVHLETRSMNTAMAQFTESTQGIVGNMAKAAQRMASGADKVGDAANELVNAIDSFETQFTDVLDNVRTDLGKAIHDMSVQASETLERGSAQLGDATREISTALGELSKDVKTTMNDVKDSINKALTIQQKAANEFTISSQALNENIAATTEIVGKLATPIEEGLQTVANSGQHMRGIGKILERAIESMEKSVSQMTELPDALRPLKALAKEQQTLNSVLEPLSALSENQPAILEELQGLRKDLKSRTVVTGHAQPRIAAS